LRPSQCLAPSNVPRAVSCQPLSPLLTVHISLDFETWLYLISALKFSSPFLKRVSLPRNLLYTLSIVCYVCHDVPATPTLPPIFGKHFVKFLVCLFLLFFCYASRHCFRALRLFACNKIITVIVIRPASTTDNVEVNNWFQWPDGCKRVLKSKTESADYCCRQVGLRGLPQVPSDIRYLKPYTGWPKKVNYYQFFKKSY